MGIQIQNEELIMSTIVKRRCWIFFHKWTPWRKNPTEFPFQPEERRMCLRCLKRQARVVI